MYDADEMSDLIAEMTLKGATEEELKTAINHSKKVLDFTKKRAECNKSEFENDIKALFDKYVSE